MKRFTIESWWGAVGAFVALQCYALLAFYLFAEAVLGFEKESGAGYFDWFCSLIAFGLGFCIFSYAEGAFLERVLSFLRDPANRRLWRDELKRSQGLIKLALLPGWIALYGALLLRPDALHLRPVNLALVAVYQLLHPFAGALAIRLDLISEARTARRHVPLREVAGLIAGSAIAGLLLIGSFFVGVPLWLALLLGFGVLIIGVMVLQLWDMSDGEREMPV